MTSLVSTVSRFHAQVERVGWRYRARIAPMAHEVNDSTHAETWLVSKDTIARPYRFEVGEDQFVSTMNPQV
jgi:hypothetical protein